MARLWRKCSGLQVSCTWWWHSEFLERRKFPDYGVGYLVKVRQLFPSIRQPTSETGHTILRHVSATVRLLATSACCEDVTPEGRQVDWNVPISSVGFPKHSSRNTGRFRKVVSAVMNSASVLRSLVRHSDCSCAVRNGALCGESVLLVLFKRPNCVTDWDEIWYAVCVVNVLGLILL